MKWRTRKVGRWKQFEDERDGFKENRGERKKRRNK
jgi:hypothetical protein